MLSVHPDFVRKPGTLGIPRRGTQTPTRYGWTDETCMAEGKKFCIKEEIPANEIQRHLINFVNYWFAPDLSETDGRDRTEIIKNVLLIMPLGVGISDELLLKDVFDSSLETTTTTTPAAMEHEKLIIKEPFLDHLDSRGKVHVLAFHGWLKQHFMQLKTMDKDTRQAQPKCAEYNLISQKLRAVLGFCALMLMRLMVQGEQQIKRYFPDGASKTFDRLFPEAGLNVYLVAPAPPVLQYAYEHLSNNCSNRIAVNLLYLLVFQYLKSVATDDESSQLARRILEEGCLNVMEGNGMGMVTLFQDVKRLYPNIEERKLISMIVHENDGDSHEDLIKFLDIYTVPGKPQYSWKWARVLSPDYFKDLNIRGNTRLCCKFAALLLDTNPGIFKRKALQVYNNRFSDYGIAWAKSAKKDLERMNDLDDHDALCASDIC